MNEEVEENNENHQITRAIPTQYDLFIRIGGLHMALFQVKRLKCV